MKPGISKSRIKRIARMRRASARRQLYVPFRDGSALAVCICVVAFAIAMAFAVFSKCGVVYSALLPSRNPAGSVWPWATLATDAAVLAGAFAVSRLLLGLLAPDVLARNSRILLLNIVAALSNALGAGVVFITAKFWPVLLPGSPPGFGHLVPFLLPAAFAPTLTTLLCGQGAGMALGFGLAVQSLLLVPRQAALPATLVALAMAAAVPMAAEKARDRAGVFRIFGIAGILQFVLLVASAAPFAAGFDEAFRAPAGPQPAVLGAALAAAAAVMLAVVPGYLGTMALLRPLEHVFAACSNLRLARFADLGNPLLSRLAIEAPGTYHHSLVVANLASRAAERVGANSLLCLVGGYYHDVGKLSNPANFTENHLPGDVNPHDSLPPNLSAIILASHVKDGIGQAVDNNLPAPVRQIIREHHGTSKMVFFLEKAKRLAAAAAATNGDEPEQVDENQYRYAGPRPNSAESAIVSIADSIEAASRSLDRPSPAAIEKLVDAIVSDKATDGQFDECPLSYADIAELRRAFTAELATIRHARIAYPGGPTSKPAAATPPPARSQDKEVSGASAGNRGQDSATDR